MSFQPLTHADSTQTPASMEHDTLPGEADFGARIRALRLTKGLTLQQLSDAAGISIGYLSQIERNRSKLPIGVARSIADALHVHLHWFFSPSKASSPAERAVIVRRGERRLLRFAGLGITEELLSPTLDGPLEMLLSTIDPGADSGDYTHEGYEGGFIIEGELDLWVDNAHFSLKSGDSFAFPSTLVHRTVNATTSTTRVLWVITPPHY